jgi:CDP-paratose 2-epimerase
MTGTPPQRSNTTAPEFGVAEWLHFRRHDLAERLAEGLEELGIEHLRLGVSWADFHRPGGKAWYDWLIPMLGRRFDLLPCVTYTPPSLGTFPSTAAPPRNPRDYADFLDGFVENYGQWFDSIELWNEPNNVLDWDWRSDPDWLAFSQMIGDAAHWMRRCGKKTVLGGMCPTDPNWLRMVAERGVLEHIDVVGIHAFPGTWSADFRDWHREVDPVRAVLDTFSWDGEIWITEGGYSTWRYDEPRQVEHLLDALQAPVARTYWYSYRDLDPELPSQEGFHFDERHYHTGLVTFAGQQKLAARLLAEGGASQLRHFRKTLSAPHVKPVRDPFIVTGGCGFIGCNLVDALAKRGEQVFVIDNFSRRGSEENAEWLKRRHPTRVELAGIDIRDRHALTEVVCNARGIFHLAAQVAVTTSVAEPMQDFRINAEGTLNLLEAVRKHNPAIPFVFASTNKVYGKLFDGTDIVRTTHACHPVDPASRAGIDEQSPLDLYSPYGCSKGCADQYVHDYARIYGLRTVVLRMSCIYGPRQFGTEDQGWIAHFMRSVFERKAITIYGDGRQVRDALFVDDAVSAWLTAADRIDRTAGRIFNLGGGRDNALSLLEMLRYLNAFDRTGVNFVPVRPGDQDWYVSDFGRFNRATGWLPTIGLEEGLTRLNHWLRFRFGGLEATGPAKGAQA